MFLYRDDRWDILEEDLEELVVVKKVDFPLLQEETDDDKFVEETIINTKQQ